MNCYVTGTDTGIGKTLASCTLLHALRARGLRVAGMKPLASGCVDTRDGLRNDDALALQRAGNVDAAYADINPYALRQPLAPELAARAQDIDIDLHRIVAAHARLSACADAVVVEGVGGWEAPLSAALLQADVVRALRVPVVLVVGLRLGCLNHARLTARAIAADGCTLAGWIGNGIDPVMQAVDGNLDLLRRDLGAPCIGVLPYQPVPQPQDWATLLRLS